MGIDMSILLNRIGQFSKSLNNQIGKKKINLHILIYHIGNEVSERARRALSFDMAI